SNLSVALIAPFFLTAIGAKEETLSFMAGFWLILKKVLPILVVPFLGALLLQKTSPKAHRKVQSAQILTFYLWAASLTVVLGNVTQFVIMHDDGDYSLEVGIALAALVFCLLQFTAGRAIGSSFGRTVAGGQVLG